MNRHLSSANACYFWPLFFFLGFAAPAFEVPSQFQDTTCFVEAEIAGIKSQKLILDTGASELVVSTKMSKTLLRSGHARRAPKRWLRTASPKNIKLNVIEINSVRLGNYEVQNVTALVLDLKELIKVFGQIDGIAGMGLFTQDSLVVDYPHKRVAIEPTHLLATNEAVSLSCEYQAHVPCVYWHGLGAEIPVQIDTGFNDYFSIATNQFALAFVQPPVMTDLVVNAGDIQPTLEARLNTNIIWGGITFERPIILLSENPGATIGSKALQHFKVTFNQSGSLLLMHPATNRVAFAGLRSLGLATVQEKLGRKVLAVIPNSTAERNGIRKGDHITVINGEPASSFDRLRFNKLIEQPYPVPVEIRRGCKRWETKLGSSLLVE